MTVLLNGQPAVSARVFVPWVGAWTAEVDLDLTVPVVPSGPCVLTIGTQPLKGTIDGDHSGRFGDTAKVRIVGGGGGWQKEVAARHFFAPGGLLSPAVIAATAAEVGEAAVVVVPEPLGPDFVRAAGPAWDVLRGRTWWVTLLGVTTVGPRVPVPYDPTAVDILTYDGESKVVEVAAESVLEPGMVLVDPRFGSVTVRDVEMTFDAGGGRGTLTCGASDHNFGSFFGRAVRAAVGVPHLKTYRYRVVAHTGPTVQLQAVDLTESAPAALVAKLWPGMAGLGGVLSPGAVVVVGFVAGDPSLPVLVHHEGGTLPVRLELDATAQVAIGGAAATHPVAKADALLTFWAAVAAALTSTGTATLTGASLAGIIAGPLQALTASLPSPKVVVV